MAGHAFACTTDRAKADSHCDDSGRGRCGRTGANVHQTLACSRECHSRLCAVSAFVRSPLRGRRLRARDLLGQPPYLARKLQGESSMAVTQESMKVCSVVDLQALCVWLSLDWLNPSPQR